MLARKDSRTTAILSERGESQHRELRTRRGNISSQPSSSPITSQHIKSGLWLWGADSEQQYTTIGHHCREAMQEFADALIKRHGPSNVEPDKAKTVARVRGGS